MTPEQTAQVVTLAAHGETPRNIEAKTGIDHVTAWRATQKPELKALIEHEAAELLTRGLKTARRTILRLAADGNTKDADKDIKKLALDASKVIINTAGLSGQAPSTVINQMIQVNEAPQQHQELMVLTDFLRNRWEGQAIGIQPAHTPAPGCPDVIDVEADPIAP